MQLVEVCGGLCLIGVILCFVLDFICFLLSSWKCSADWLLYSSPGYWCFQSSRAPAIFGIRNHLKCIFAI